MKDGNEKSILENPVLVTGLLPFLPGTKDFASAAYLAVGLVSISLVLQVLSAAFGRFLKPWAWKAGILFVSAIFISIAMQAVELADKRSAMALAEVAAFAVFSGVLRFQYGGWREDIERRVYFKFSRLLPVLLSAIGLLAFGAIRELIGSGSLSLPGFGHPGARIRAFPFSRFPSLVFAMPAGALFLAGFASAALKRAGASRKERESER